MALPGPLLNQAQHTAKFRIKGLQSNVQKLKLADDM